MLGFTYTEQSQGVTVLETLFSAWDLLEEEDGQNKDVVRRVYEIGLHDVLWVVSKSCFMSERLRVRSSLSLRVWMPQPEDAHSDTGN